MSDSLDYTRRKAFFERMLTVYGRKAVLETLQRPQLQCHALHLAHSNREHGVVSDIRALAEKRGIEVCEHTREALARISRNGRQDQGVALDVICPEFTSAEQALPELPPQARLLALDSVTNPQNLGMIIRSAAAGNIDGLIYARRGNAALGPLVIKASAGTVFRAPLLQCDHLLPTLERYQNAGFEICVLAADGRESLFALHNERPRVFVLGNETEGVSTAIQALAQRKVSIPMHNGVESLNVAVSASLIAYAGQLHSQPG